MGVDLRLEVGDLMVDRLERGLEFGDPAGDGSAGHSPVGQGLQQALVFIPGCGPLLRRPAKVVFELLLRLFMASLGRF